MSLMDNLKKGFDKAREEAGELAQTAKHRREIGRLNSHKERLYMDMGERLHARVREGKSAHGFERECAEVDRIDGEVAAAQAEIERLRATESAKPGAAAN